MVPFGKFLTLNWPVITPFPLARRRRVFSIVGVTRLRCRCPLGPTSTTLLTVIISVNVTLDLDVVCAVTSSGGPPTVRTGRARAFSLLCLVRYTVTRDDGVPVADVLDVLVGVLLGLIVAVLVGDFVGGTEVLVGRTGVLVDGAEMAVAGNDVLVAVAVFVAVAVLVGVNV